MSDGRCVFANFLAVLIFFSSSIFLSCFHSKSFFKSIFFFSFVRWICLKNRLEDFLHYNFSHACIYNITERLVRMAKKEKQRFCQYRAERGSQTTSTSSAPACLVAGFDYLIVFIMKSSINVSMVRASTYSKQGYH